MLAVGHAGQGRQRLALRTGAHDDDLIVGQVINVEGIDDIGIVDVEIAKLNAPTRVLVSMERPVTTTLRPHLRAASQICCRRWMWLENDATNTRPGAFLMACSRLGPTRPRTW